MTLARFLIVALLGQCLIAAPALAAHTPMSDEMNVAPKTVLGFAPHPELFGTQERFEQSTAEFPQWTDMTRRSAAQFAAADHVCKPGESAHCTPREWSDLVARLRPLPLREKLAAANDAINRHPYVTTEANWHRVMYWETPFQFIRRGGQCQDYAIAKYYLLRQAGVPVDALRMVVLHATAIGADHAVLAVFVDGEALILDNLRPDIVSSDRAVTYRPYYSINEAGWWLQTGPRAQSSYLARR